MITMLMTGRVQIRSGKAGIMKNVLVAIILCIIGGLSVAGCNSNESKPIKTDMTDESLQVAESEPAEKEDEDEEKSPEKEINNGKPKSTASEENKGEAEIINLTEAECIEKTDLLRKTEPVRIPNEETLSDIARCVTFSRVLDEKGMIFSQMDNYKRAALRHQIIDALMWGDSKLYGAIPVESGVEGYNADSIIKVEDAKELFKDIYGEEDYTPTEYEHIEDGYILISYGDGDPWHMVEHMQFFEDEDHILLTGPAFYEDNGGSRSFLGYADILFEKNPDSRYGVTLLYGRYRDEKIKITSVVTSSQLPDAAGKSYSGMNLVDGDPATAWCEGVAGTGAGETITLRLDKEQKVFGVVICNGYTADYDLYTNNGMLTRVEVDFGNGYLVRGSLDGYAYEGYSTEDLVYSNLNRIELDEPVMTDTIKITIMEAERGNKYDDTCVSEIAVY